VARLLLAMMIAAQCGAALAAEDAALEKRVQAISAELRCLVCQNQTLADSNAPLAVDLRNQVRAQLQGGASEREVRDWMVARYGDFVLYRPPFNAATALLWAGPFLFLFLGLVIVLRRVAGRRATEKTLSAEERARAAELLK
jgi:cytochrome c-type biogenesis protein CcmH